MRWREGTGRQKAVYALLVSLYALGVLLAAADKLQRVGRPDVGFIMDGLEISPSRRDSADLGLRGGARIVEVNGQPVAERSIREEVWARLAAEPGEANELVVQHPGGGVGKLAIPVRDLRMSDVVYAEGGVLALGFLFFIVGVVTFQLRPYAPESWALLALCSVSGGFLSMILSGVGPAKAPYAIYYRTMLGLLAAVPLHAGLAFPVVHRALLRKPPRVLFWIYGLGLLHAAAQITGWATEFAGPTRYIGIFDTGLLLVVTLYFVGRCAALSMHTADPLVAQRARILLGGVLLGGSLPATVRFVQATTGMHVLDIRVAYWSISILLLALARTTLRHELLNARVAARRAIVYGAAVSALTVLAVALVSVSPYLVALLLLPLLYVWPRFEALLNAWLYPQRLRLPETVRRIGEELAAATDADAVLDALAAAPARLADVGVSSAFLFEGVAGPAECLRGAGARKTLASAHKPLATEPLVQLMVTLRKEIFRDQLAVEPQFANIQAECHSCFERLGADALVPIVRDARVIGGLALGARERGDAWERLELEVLQTIAQQGVQALIRIEATERLRSRELEFAELKRFFPPQIIEQVMARGGAAELRSQRKLVTVFFADLRGFTSFSESVEPEEVMATLAEYHHAMGRRVTEFAGTLERFAGDGFMVFFNDPVEQDDHVHRAAQMALAMHRDIAQLRTGWATRRYRIDAGMGIHTGYATCGFIGYEGRRDYGVIGNVTNLAARLSDAAKGGEILVSAAVRGQLFDMLPFEAIGELELPGFHAPQPTFRLLAAVAD
ncbi:MAG TPA: adenylate/guanylate cyclase domain-containing protein [Myxococcota bacterium]|nr:adenylate/guanylate cyclase domain-containing protein [Myxococcota bacterium]